MSLLKDGNYRGIGKGDQGEIIVSVEIRNGHISTVHTLKEQESPTVGWKALSTLEDRIIKKQSCAIDVVSGATNTSQGFKQAVQQALKEASING